MNGHPIQTLATECIQLLEAWPGPGEDPAILEALARRMAGLTGLTDPDFLSRCQAVTRAFEALLHALEARDSNWRQSQDAVLASLRGILES